MSNSVVVHCDAVCKTRGFTMLALSLHSDGVEGANLEFIPDHSRAGDNLALESGIAIGKNGVVIIPEDYTDNIWIAVKFGNLYTSVKVSSDTEVGPVAEEK